MAKYYFINTRELTNTDGIPDKQWIEMAENAGVTKDTYVLTEKQFEEYLNGGYPYLELCEYRKL